jgi:hypothetical protein
MVLIFQVVVSKIHVLVSLLGFPLQFDYQCVRVYSCNRLRELLDLARRFGSLMLEKKSTYDFVVTGFT